MEIRSFREVVLTTHKTLILCDIDDTLLRWDRTPESCFAEAAAFFPKDSAKFQQAFGQNLWINYRQSVPPIWTDRNGFADMVRRLSDESRLAFLTARTGGIYEHWTQRDFASLGIPYESKDVFYTGNRMTKGEFIQNHIPLGEYERVVFIDDLPENILSVSTAFPAIECYLWTK